ncbi:unnamed protein product, partial [Mesorhabditis spiculigera]
MARSNGRQLYVPLDRPPRRMNSGKDDMREYCVNGQMSSSQNEEEEGPSTSTATGPSRTENVRRSLKDLKKDMGRNFDALVHRPRMERIT